jgi:hypothetical protein
MYKRKTAAGCLAIAVTVMVLGCDKSPTSPGPRPPAPPPPLPQARTLSVVSGWDQSAVAGAQVRVNDTMLTTDAQGQFVCSETVAAEAAIDVDASGFLPHRTRLFGVPSTNVIELWPAANAAEAAAIRSLVFGEWRGEFFLSRPGWPAFQLALLAAGLPRTPSEVSSDWMREYIEIEALTKLPLSISFTPRGFSSDQFENEVIVAFDGTEESCRNPWGFCEFWDNSVPYYSRPYRIVRTIADRPDVIRRVLASGLLQTNPLPGLLNKSAPAAEFSLLEKQTLRMQAIRPPGTRWPDTAPFR